MQLKRWIDSVLPRPGVRPLRDRYLKASPARLDQDWLLNAYAADSLRSRDFMVSFAQALRSAGQHGYVCAVKLVRGSGVRCSKQSHASKIGSIAGTRADSASSMGRTVIASCISFEGDALLCFSLICVRGKHLTWLERARANGAKFPIGRCDWPGKFNRIHG